MAFKHSFYCYVFGCKLGCNWSGIWSRNIPEIFFKLLHITIWRLKWLCCQIGIWADSPFSDRLLVLPMPLSSVRAFWPSDHCCLGSKRSRPGRAVIASPGVGGEFLRGRHSWDSLRRRAVSPPIDAARRLRAVRGVSAAPFHAWMVAVSGISKMNGPEHGGFAWLTGPR